MDSFRTLFVLPLIMMAVGCAGRFTPSLDPGEKHFDRGVLTAVLASPIDDVYRATKAAMEKLRLRPLDRDRDAFTGKLVGSTAAGKDIWVNVERLTKETTKVTLKVFFTRDRKVQNALLEEIEARLGTAGS